MSGEQLTSKNLRTPNVNSFNKQKSSRVNINNLLYRVRAEKVREKTGRGESKERQG